MVLYKVIENAQGEKPRCAIISFFDGIAQHGFDSGI